MDSTEGLEHNKRTLFNFSIVTFFEDYGWFILLLSVILFFIYKKLQPTINKYLQIRSNREYSAKYHKDPDAASKRIAAQMSAVEKFQTKYNRDAVVYQEKLELKQEKKRQEFLAQHPESGQKLGGSSGTLRNNEYNPLMGNSSGNSYKPQRKSPCSGGGCGKK